jgi:hypothetical protein
MEGKTADDKDVLYCHNKGLKAEELASGWSRQDIVVLLPGRRRKDTITYTKDGEEVTAVVVVEADGSTKYNLPTSQPTATQSAAGGK